jgi:hypothetical protein
VAVRYGSARRDEKKRILDEFAALTGYHRKHAIRALRAVPSSERGEAPARTGRTRVYREEVVTALTVLWEAADRICGKRLKQAIPTFITAMERHGHLSLEPETRNQLLSMSAATIDRLLRPVRDVARQGRRRTGVNTTLRKSIAVRTFEDWNDPPPGYFEMDMVAHCAVSHRNLRYCPSERRGCRGSYLAASHGWTSTNSDRLRSPMAATNSQSSTASHRSSTRGCRRSTRASVFAWVVKIVLNGATPRRVAKPVSLATW